MSFSAEKPGATTPWPAINQFLAFDERFAVQGGGKRYWLLLPKSVASLTALLYHLREYTVPFVVLGRGSNTPSFPSAEVCVSTRALSRLYYQDGVVTVEAGCDLNTFHATLFQEKEELALEDDIASSCRGSVASIVIRGAQAGTVLKNCPTPFRLLGAQLVCLDGGILELGHSLGDCSIGPPLHSLIWGCQSLPAIVTKLSFRTEPIPRSRLKFAWTFLNQKELWSVWELLQSISRSWEKLDCIISAAPGHKSFILAQLSGGIEEMEAFQQMFPFLSSYLNSSLEENIKRYLHSKPYHFWPIQIEMPFEVNDPESYFWYHSLTQTAWKITLQPPPEGYKLESNLPLWKEKWEKALQR